MSQFRTGRSNGCAVLNPDGTLLIMAPNLTSAESICLALNAAIVPNVVIPSDAKSMLDLKMNLIKDGEAAYRSNEARKAYNRGVSHTFASLMEVGALRLDADDSIDHELKDDELSEIAKQIVNEATKDGNGFIDSISHLVRFLKNIRKKGRMILIDQKEVDIDWLFRKVECKQCLGLSSMDGKPCSTCNGKGEVKPELHHVKERLRKEYLHNEGSSHRAKQALLRLIRALHLQGMAYDFRDAFDDAVSFLSENGVYISDSHSDELLKEADEMGIYLFHEAGKYGDRHPIGTFTKDVDLDVAIFLEHKFSMTTENALDGYSINGMMKEGKDGYSVACDNESELGFMTLTCRDHEDIDKQFTWMVGPERLKDAVEALKEFEQNKQRS